MIDVLIVTLLIVVAFLATSAAVIFPPTSLTLVVTACGILLLWRFQRAQIRLAERKLFLDLMPRRADWYEEVKRALEGRAVERKEHIEAVLAGGVPGNPDYLMKLHQLETEAGWLFSTEMLALMAMMIEADKQLNDTQFKARAGDEHAATEVGGRVMALYEAQSKVQGYLARYLYVGDIGKPKRSPVKFLKVK